MATHSGLDKIVQNQHNKAMHKNNIKCAQLNLQHSRVATSNLPQIILQYNIDIAFVQEPYTLLNNVVGFPKGFRILTHGGGRNRAAIVVNNNDVDITAITQVSHEDAILTEIRYKGVKFYGASIYLPIDRDIERDLDTIENILQFTTGDGLILAIDSNGRNKLWSDKCTNTRGRALEEFIISRDLFIIDEDSDIPTFETNRGCSWIDLTIGNNVLAQKTRGWSCGDEESCSDHKLISFEIENRNGGGNETQLLGKRYKIKADNWGTFDIKLGEQLIEKFDCQVQGNNLTIMDNAISHKVKQCEDIGIVVQKFTEAITAACEAAFRVSKPGKRANKQRSVPWWTPELTSLRKKALALRRRYQKIKTDPNLRQERKLLYLGGNRMYQAKLREEKTRSWKNFCTSTDSTNPWNAVYRYAAGKQRSKPTLATLRNTNNTYTTDMLSTIDRLMDHFVPEDKESGDGAHH